MTRPYRGLRHHHVHHRPARRRAKEGAAQGAQPGTYVAAASRSS
ncbi:MAG: hypothetical protein ACLT98_12295 [Eggerthellaceae bacterium]